MTHIEASDQTGQRFLIFEGDPAWGLAGVLIEIGVREIVLPRQTLVTGRLVSVSVPSSMETWDPTKPAVAEMLRRYVRLRDCEVYLGDSRPDPEVAVGGPPAVGASEDRATG